MSKPNVREQIIEAGLKSLLERGFNGVAVQEITSAAGVPKGSFYNHFASKEALGAELVERYGQSAHWAALTDTSTPPLERLRRHYKVLSDRFTAANFKRGCMLGNFSAELANQSPLIRDSLAKVFAKWTGGLEAAITEAQADGSISSQTPASDLAAFLLDAFEGAILRARIERTPRPFGRFMTLAFDHILK